MALHRLAGSLRQRPTDAERRLWYRLRSLRAVGIIFRRQRPIGRYIVDFICLERRIVIEVDGGQHSDCIDDRLRDIWLSQHGYTVLRFWNTEVLKQSEAVLQKIVQSVSEVPPAVIRPAPTAPGN
jgi:very-short-patch-repair endonuclease